MRAYQLINRETICSIHAAFIEWTDTVHTCLLSLSFSHDPTNTSPSITCLSVCACAYVFPCVFACVFPSVLACGACVSACASVSPRAPPHLFLLPPDIVVVPFDHRVGRPMCPNCFTRTVYSNATRYIMTTIIDFFHVLTRLVAKHGGNDSSDSFDSSKQLATVHFAAR